VGWPPTADEILDLVEGGVHQRTDKLRFDLMDIAGGVIGELHPDLEDTPRMTNDTSRSVFRTVDQLMLPASEHTHINGVQDRVQVWMILQDGTEYSLGKFLWGDDTHPVREWGHEHHSVLVDYLHPLTTPRGRTSGSKVGQNIVQRAIDHARLVVSADDIDAVSSPATLSAPLAWTPDDTIQTIVNDHLTLAGYHSIYYDRNGRLQMRPVPADISSEPPDLTYTDGGRVERDSIVWANDLLQAPNEFVVWESSGEGPPRVGRYAIPSSAPHSAQNRGFVWRRVESMQGLSDQGAADRAAQALAVTDRKATFEWRTWTSSADPRHDTYDIIDFYGDHFLEVRWTLDLVPGGKMTHQARRVY
jgi:hypothetical protein